MLHSFSHNEAIMRFMLKFTIPVERGNAAKKDGTLEKAIDALIRATKAGAAYFTVVDGKRAGLVFFEETDASRFTEINEPFFAAVDASIEILPVLSHKDLDAGLAQ
jgi:hypothetical protein